MNMEHEQVRLIRERFVDAYMSIDGEVHDVLQMAWVGNEIFERNLLGSETDQKIYGLRTFALTDSQVNGMNFVLAQMMTMAEALHAKYQAAYSYTVKSMASEAQAAPDTQVASETIDLGSLDDELLRLGNAWEAAQNRVESAAKGTDEAEFAALCKAVTQLEFAIQAVPARTIYGLAVKARIAMQYAPQRDPGVPVLDDMLAVLLDDVLRIAEIGLPPREREYP